MTEQMVKDLQHDPLLLARKSKSATVADIEIATDLMDTLKAHKESCVGMAANMIGEPVSIICFLDGAQYKTMFNPVIVAAKGEYETEEKCLSLLGGPRKTKRFTEIEVAFEVPNGKKRTKIYRNFTAQIIQHEIDHCNGILI